MRAVRRELFKSLKFAQNPKANFSAISMLPSLITLISLCFGVTSIKLALNQHFELAVGSVFLSIFFDGIDGAIARKLKVSSIFGAQLDSLSDFACFGIAPPLLIYIWILHDLKIYGWASIIAYVISIALRLARFNSNIIEPKKKYDWQGLFFEGVPSPASASLILFPLILSFEDIGILNNPNLTFISGYIFFVSILPISRIPTFSVKKLRIPKNNLLIAMFCAGIYMIMLITSPWTTLTVSISAYIAALPVSAIKFSRLMKKSRVDEKLIYSSGTSPL